MRAGAYGEYEKKFLEENRIHLTWNEISKDLTTLGNKDELRSFLKDIYPEKSNHTIGNFLGQIWSFTQKIKIGDWIVLPSKHKPAIHVAKVKSKCTYNPDEENPFSHYLDVEWIEQDVPRTNFDEDMLYSFNGLRTIYEVSRHDAEQRIRRMANNDWKSSSIQPVNEEEILEDGEELENLLQAARDQIAKLIIARFKGHGMTWLVDAVLRAQGYKTYRSPEGPDKGIDILAAPEPMGFGKPRVCVQVKSGDSALDRPTLDQLIGTMQNVRADHGLLVSWGGFKSSVDKEKATQFFQVRLWDQGDLIDQVLLHYDKLDEEIRAKLPLKRI